MRVLVTGGSGVIGEGLIPCLLEHGHRVRLLTRDADTAVRDWPDQVESFAADVTRADQLRGAASDCDAVVHITGIIAESPPDITYQKVNVEGTRNLLEECARAGQPKVIFISSLGAERGTSAYHVSKRDAEALVREYPGPWLILRSGNVYGPGDAVISQLLKMHRTLPAVPVIGAGDHQFQPIWYSDLGKAIDRAIDRDLSGGVFEVAGEDVTTANDILSQFERLTGRSPARIPLPEFLVGITARMADSAGFPLPITESQFQMLIEENVVRDPAGNALTRVFGVPATSLNDGLTRLADAQPEQTPDEGVGGLEQKRFWADIAESRYRPEELMQQFRERCTDLMPIEFDVEPGTPQRVVEGATLTAALPLRGNVQIRVVECAECAVTFATLRGHPLAGVVRFTATDQEGGLVRFAVNVFARAATMLDWLALSTVGGAAQNSTWRTVVERIVELSGGRSEGVKEEKSVVRGEEGEAIDDWVGELVAQYRRAAHQAPGSSAGSERPAGEIDRSGASFS
jgi:nucleoside-diphosphate-sugar epimerase